MRRLLYLLALIPQPAAAAGAEVRFTQVNGEPNTASTLTVHAGDVITLSVDVLQMGGDCSDPAGCAQNRDIEDFDWRADDRPGNECRPAVQRDCLSTSDFQLNDYGVSFYVPSGLSHDVRVTASNPAAATSATILLRPDSDESTAIAVTAASEPIYYYDHVLAGRGRWVYISHQRHWVPYTYQANWTPYQNGYWSWVDGDGLTWVSYDPWGATTDHYGVWRHHLTYGWIWQPFAQPVYHPAVVSWYYGHNFTGWYPYYAAEPTAYRYGYKYGFNDGYWAGYQAHTLAGNRGAYTFGLTAVANRDVSAHNVYAVRASDAVSVGVWSECAAAGHVTPTPGGKVGPASRVWLEDRMGEPLQTTRTQTVQVKGIALTQPQPVHPLPAFYQTQAAGLGAKHNAPVGSIVVNAGGQPQITPPVAGGRSLTHNPASDQAVAPRLRTKAPAQPRPDHPYAARQKLPKIHPPPYQSEHPKKKKD